MSVFFAFSQDRLLKKREVAKNILQRIFEPDPLVTVDSKTSPTRALLFGYDCGSCEPLNGFTDFAFHMFPHQMRCGHKNNFSAVIKFTN